MPELRGFLLERGAYKLSDRSMSSRLGQPAKAGPLPPQSRDAIRFDAMWRSVRCRSAPLRSSRSWKVTPVELRTSFRRERKAVPILLSGKGHASNGARRLPAPEGGERHGAVRWCVCAGSGDGGEWAGSGGSTAEREGVQLAEVRGDAGDRVPVP